MTSQQDIWTGSPQRQSKYVVVVVIIDKATGGGMVAWPQTNQAMRMMMMEKIWLFS